MVHRHIVVSHAGECDVCGGPRPEQNKAAHTESVDTEL